MTSVNEVLTREEAIAAAKKAASDLKSRGYKGRIRVLSTRVELLARTPSRPGRSLHVTWHPQGRDSEWLDGSPSKNWPLIIKG